MKPAALRPLLVANHDHVIGGGEIGLLMLAEGLVARGHRPLLAVPGSGSFAPGFESCRISNRPARTAEDLGRAAIGCDLIHTYSTQGLAAAALASTGRPVILHALIPNRSHLDATVADAATHIVCNSWATARRFGDRDNVTVVFNGIRPPRPRAERLFDKNRRHGIAIVGPTVPRKGQVDALPALQEVLAARSDVDVTFVGRIGGPHGRLLRRVAAASGGRIRLLGFEPEIADHLSEFSLVLVPSRSEGFGRVAVEAMRAGVPVLATQVEGLIEALADLPDPWLPERREHWAARILRELDGPAHSRAQLMAAGARFDPDRFVDEIVGIYRQLLDPVESRDEETC